MTPASALAKKHTAPKWHALTRPPEAEGEKYYTEHAKEFETPRQGHAAHVLVVVPQTGGSEAEDKAREKVADVIRRAKAGEDFGKIAKDVGIQPH